MDPSLMGIASGTTVAVDQYSAFPIAGSTGVAMGTGTSQHGITPLTGNGGGMGDAINSVWTWLNKPFETPFSPVTTFAAVGAVLVAILLWNMILYHVRIAAESI